jgi:hypothetical protein
MKKYLLSLILLGGTLIGNAQVDTSMIRIGSVPDTEAYITVSDWGSGYTDSNGVRVTKWDKAGIEIHGDTMAAIRLLLKTIDDGNKREMDLYDLISKAVDFTNQVPDYWKTSKHNTAWNKYYSALRKQGFKEVPAKKK